MPGGEKQLPLGFTWSGEAAGRRTAALVALVLLVFAAACVVLAIWSVASPHSVVDL